MVSPAAMTAAALAGALTLAACGDGGAGDGRAATAAPSARPDAPPAAPTQATARTGPEQREFRDWRAVCDNGNRCWAYSGSDVGGFVLVRMDAGPTARPEIHTGMSATSSGVRLAIDGKPQTLAAGPKGTQSQVVPAGDVSANLTRLAAAREIKLVIPDFEVAIPVAGASAALLWIDERQGRLGTTTALIRRGDRPADSVPAAPALPRVSAAAAASQKGLEGATDPMEDGDTAGIPLPTAIEALPAVKACRTETGDYLQKAVLAGRLAQDIELWGVPCFSGAYNAGYELYLSDAAGGSPRKAVFPGWDGQPPDPDEFGSDGLVNPVFDPRANTIGHFPKGRGLGDCG